MGVLQGGCQFPPCPSSMGPGRRRWGRAQGTQLTEPPRADFSLEPGAQPHPPGLTGTRTLSLLLAPSFHALFSGLRWHLLAVWGGGRGLARRPGRGMLS